MNIEKKFKQFEASRPDLEDLTAEELLQVIQDPNTFKKKKIVQQKPLRKVRTKRNRKK